MAGPSRLVCPGCQFVSPHRMRFCGLCGSPLDAATQDSGRPVLKAALGERRLLTVVFCDLVGSTQLAETLDPEDLRRVILAYRECCVTAIQDAGGTVGQYLGDGILAYFGHPRAHEDDAWRALHAALRARSGVRNVSDRLRREGTPLPTPLSIRIGVHSGLVVVADLGKGRNAEAASVVGAPTNIAARLQAAAASDTILTSESTIRLAKNRFEVSDAGVRRFAGVDEPLQAFEVIREVRDGTVPVSCHSTPLVGRQDELAALQRLWTEVATTGGASLVIEAEPGVGKTRLVNDFRASLGAAGRRAVMLACFQEDRSSPYQPVLSLIRSVLAVTEGAEPGTIRSALRRALGPLEHTPHEVVIAGLLDCATDDERQQLAQAPRRRRKETLDALIAFISVRLGASGPYLVVVEDTHWADPSTMALLKAWVERCAAGWNGLVLTTTRPSKADRYEHSSPVLRLQRLGEADARHLVRALVPREMPEDVVDQIVQRTDGVPLFAEEVARLAKTSGISDEADRWAGSSNIPLTLRSALAAQLDGLREAKDVAQLGAVLGRSFQSDVLEAVLDEAERPGAALALTRLVDGRLLERLLPEWGGMSHTFRHVLIRDTAYDSILRDRRRALHSRIARVLRESFPGLAQARPEIVAQHFSLAGMALDAAGQFEAAARRAATGSSHSEAAEHCQAGLAELAKTLPGPQRGELEVRLQILSAAQIIAICGNADPAVREAFERAGQVAEELGHLAGLRRALRGLHTYHLVRGDIAAGYRISQRVIALAGDTADLGQRIQLHRPHGLTLLYFGRFEEARRELAAAVSLYDAALHSDHRFEYGSDPLVLARCHLGWVEWFLGDENLARKESEAALSAARSLNHPHSLAFALAFDACLREFMGDVAAARDRADELVQVAEHHDYTYWSAWGRIVGGWARAVSHNGDGGEAMLRRGLSEYEATGAGLLVPYANHLLAGIIVSPDGQERERMGAFARKTAADGAMGLWEAWLVRRHSAER